MNILNKLEEKLKEEQWTRASIENFNIQTLETLLEEIISHEQEKIVFEQTLDFLKHSPKSIIALYLTGFLAYELDEKDYVDHLYSLLEIFKENKKFNIVENITQKILEKDPNDQYVLEILLQIYTEHKKEVERINILMRLIKVDNKNGSIPEKIAEYFEQQKNNDESISQSNRYYQLALRRYTKVQNFTKIEQIWRKLLPSNYQQINFFMGVASSLTDINPELNATLLLTLVETLEENNMLDEALFILKKMIITNESNNKIREKIIVIYTFQYSDNPQFELCLNNSQIQDQSVSISSAVKKFEKEILFQVEGYVYHKTWGIGVLQKFENDSFILDFDDRKNHKMSYNMALSSLTPLKSDHIWVVKKLNQVGNLQTEKEISNILLIILRSFSGKNLATEDFKSELCPTYVGVEVWNNWWNKAKKILQNLPSVGTFKEGRPKYYIRTIDIRFEEELIEKFHESKKFDDKLSIFEKFLKEVHDIEHLADEFKDMISYFEGILNNSRYEFNERIISFTLLNKVKIAESWAVQKIEPLDKELINEENLFNFLVENYKIEYKKEIIHLIIQNHENYLELLTNVLLQDKDQISDFIIEQLEQLMSHEDLSTLINQGLYNIFRENPIMTIWFLKYLLTNKRYEDFNFQVDELYVEVLYRMDTLGKIFSQKKLNWFKIPLYTTEVKKIINMANDILFKNQNFITYISSEATEEYVHKIYQLSKSSFGLHPKNKVTLIKTINEQFPSIEITEDIKEELHDVDYFNENIIWTTQEGLEKQQQSILKLQRERSENLIELEEAREKGDLRENAEYQAAREKDNLLNTSIQEIGEQIQKAIVLNFSHIKGDIVIPGTTAHLLKDGVKESYTILGFWDTNEEKKIIAYNSPLARAIIGLKVGDNVAIPLGDHETKITIKKITIVKQ